MSELDLDALERRWRIGQPDRPTAVALIQRLRKAEIRAERNDKAFDAQTQRLREAEYGRDVIAPASRDDAEDVFEINQRLQARITQLERVRKAAIKLEEVIVFPATTSWHVSEMVGCRDELRAALAAVEESAKT